MYSKWKKSENETSHASDEKEGDSNTENDVADAFAVAVVQGQQQTGDIYKLYIDWESGNDEWQNQTGCFECWFLHWWYQTWRILWILEETVWSRSL